MAKDPFTAALTGVTSEVDRRQANLTKLQDKLRGNPYDAATREQVQAAKRELIVLLDEQAELQRAVSRAAGGKQHRVEP